MDSTLEEKINWLVDRALISDLLFSFARALDTRDPDTYIANFVQEGVLELPDPSAANGEMIVVPRERMRETMTHGLFNFSATHHLSTNHQITVSGDTAGSRSYLQAVHVGKDPFDHWDAGGWYDCTYRRTSEGWKFTHVRLTSVWMSGTPHGIKPQ